MTENAIGELYHLSYRIFPLINYQGSLQNFTHYSQCHFNITSFLPLK